MFEDMFEEMRRLQNELNRSFGNFWESDEYLALPDKEGKGQSLVMRNPLTDLEETDKEIIARFEIPGVDKKDIQLNITENKIEVKVEKKKEAKVDKKGYYRTERRYAGFYRAMALPEGIHPEKAKAKYSDGILEVRMPKTETKKISKLEIE